MYEIYDPQKAYTLPNGEQGTLERLKKDFPLCDTVPYAVNAADGILSEMTRLSVMKGIYHVTEEDNQAAIEAINAAIEARSPDPATLDDIQAQLDALAGVTA